MAKVVFVYPDYENLGIEHLMSICRSEGHEIDLVYYEANNPYLNRKSQNIDYSLIANQIIATHPDIVAFSCVTDNYQNQLTVANTLKKSSPDLYTIFGGIHPSIVPERVFKNDSVDSIAIGEAEISFPEFLSAGYCKNRFVPPDREVPGIVFKKNNFPIGKFIEGPLVNLDKIPRTEKSYFLNVIKEMSNEYRIITSRGCPNQCSYCFHSYLKRSRGRSVIRQRSVDNVMEELLWAKKNFDFKNIIFLDDCFTFSEEWIYEFCHQYRQKIKTPFACISIPDYLTKPTINALASAGCVNIQLGIQTISVELSHTILKRKLNLSQTTSAIRSLKKKGIMVQVDHLLGIPKDSLKQQEQSVLFYNSLRPDLISTFWLTYFPKTQIIGTAKQNGLITEEEIGNLENGLSLTGESCLTGGSMKNPDPYYSIAFLLNYLPLLPKWLVRMLVISGFYRIFKIKNYYISIALPRAIQSIFNKKDFRGQTHLIRFFREIKHNCIRDGKGLMKKGILLLARHAIILCVLTFPGVVFLLTGDPEEFFLASTVSLLLWSCWVLGRVARQTFIKHHSWIGFFPQLPSAAVLVFSFYMFNFFWAIPIAGILFMIFGIINIKQVVCRPVFQTHFHVAPFIFLIAALLVSFNYYFVHDDFTEVASVLNTVTDTSDLVLVMRDRNLHKIIGDIQVDAEISVENLELFLRKEDNGLEIFLLLEDEDFANLSSTLRDNFEITNKIVTDIDTYFILKYQYHFRSDSFRSKQHTNCLDGVVT